MTRIGCMALLGFGQIRGIGRGLVPDTLLYRDAEVRVLVGTGGDLVAPGAFGASTP
jgi:hypothetical protein